MALAVRHQQGKIAIRNNNFGIKALKKVACPKNTHP